MKLFSILLLILISSCSTAQNPTISPSEFQKATAASDVQILDVRTPEEYNEGFINGAVLANWNDQISFQEGVSKLDSTQTVYIYCRSGKRSAAAQEWMLTNGFKHVINLEGGILSWNAAGFPTEIPKKMKGKKN